MMKALLLAVCLTVLASNEHGTQQEGRVMLRPRASSEEENLGKIARALQESLEKLNYAVKEKQVGEQKEEEQRRVFFRALPQ